LPPSSQPKVSTFLFDDQMSSPYGSRYWLALRRYYISAKEPAFNPVPMLDARSELHIIRSKLWDANWKLMAAVGIGSDYSEISVLLGTSAAAARIRVMRLRQQITAKAA
jgi:hypothetical protein